LLEVSKGSSRTGARPLALEPSIDASKLGTLPNSFEHDGTLDAVGTTIRGGLAIGRGSSRHNRVFGKVIADTVASPLEEQINGTENMLYMFSQAASDGLLTLTVTFKLGTDPNLTQATRMTT
jgi:hypothetical protein